MKFSIVEESCFPYAPAKQNCRFELLSAKTLEDARCYAPRNASRTELYKVGPAYSFKNETDIMIEIQKQGPVQGIIYHF